MPQDYIIENMNWPPYFYIIPFLVLAVVWGEERELQLFSIQPSIGWSLFILQIDNIQLLYDQLQWCFVVCVCVGGGGGVSLVTFERVEEVEVREDCT